MEKPGPVVLIADDDDDSRYVISRLLTHRGFVVLQATDGLQAVALASARLPALIIMDYLLPGITGWEATRRLRADPATAGTIIINMTAYSYDGIEADARAAGCDAFLAKPCDPFDVVAMVTRLVGAPDGQVPSPRLRRPDAADDAAVA
jgi:two-component system cell cycle response regulator DivK